MDVKIYYWMVLTSMVMEVAIGKASPEPSRSFKPPPDRLARGSSYYSEPVNIQGKNHRADFDSNKNNDYTFVHVVGNTDLNIGKNSKGIYDVYHQYDHEQEESDYNADESTYYHEEGKMYYRPTSTRNEEPSYNKPVYHKEPSYEPSHAHLDEHYYKIDDHREKPSYKDRNLELELPYNPSSMYRDTPYAALKEEPTYRVYNHREEPVYLDPSYKLHKEEPSYISQNYREEAPYQAQNQEEESRYTLPNIKHYNGGPLYKALVKEEYNHRAEPSYQKYQTERLEAMYKPPVYLDPSYGIYKEEPSYMYEPSYKTHHHREEPSSYNVAKEVYNYGEESTYRPPVIDKDTVIKHPAPFYERRKDVEPYYEESSKPNHELDGESHEFEYPKSPGLATAFYHVRIS